MKEGILFRLAFGKITLRRQVARCVLALLVAVSSVALAQSESVKRPHRAHSIPAREFSRIIQEFSENEGVFPTDNFTSNERAYLNVVDQLHQLGVSGGAYVGVGPEQNFSYIAKVRPQIAFIVDIRREAVIQHLLYKAIFHLAKNRAQFLSLLFSRPIPEIPSGGHEPLPLLVDRIGKESGPREVFAGNLAAVRKTIEEEFEFPLSAQDAKTLEYIYNSFWEDGLEIGFRFGTGGVRIVGSWWFPVLRELLLATDQRGKLGNFLAREGDYQFVRKLQERNMVIPVVGDFAGGKALRSVAEYLRENGYTVSAFYTSNVEEYLYFNQVFGAFAANVGRLPISERSVFIRAVRAGWTPSSFYVRNDRIEPYLERISVFLRDFSAGRIPTYRDLVTIDYLPHVGSQAGDSPLWQ